MVESLESRRMLSVSGTLTPDSSGVEGTTATHFQLSATVCSAGCGGCGAEYLVNYTVDYGDGAIEGGQFPANSTGYSTSLSHLYSEESPSGGFNAVLVVFSTKNSNKSTAKPVVKDASLTPFSADTANLRPNQQFSGVVASWEDKNPNSVVEDFNTVSINWGDGSPDTTSGNISVSTVNGKSRFSASADHTFTKAGTFTVRTSVTDVGGAKTTVNSNFVVTASREIRSGHQTFDVQVAGTPVTSSGGNVVDLPMPGGNPVPNVPVTLTIVDSNLLEFTNAAGDQSLGSTMTINTGNGISSGFFGFYVHAKPNAPVGFKLTILADTPFANQFTYNVNLV